MFFIGGITGYTQHIKSLHPNQPIKSLVLKQWTAEDGLISNNLTSVNIDTDGFVWITSFNGLLKFDGNSFELFDKEKLPFLQSNAFIDTYANADSNLFFATQASGIIQFEKWKFSKPDFNQNIPRYIRNVYVDKSGTIWAGSNNEGLYKISNGVVEKIDDPAVNNITIVDITEDEDGRLYIATWGNGLIVRDGDFIRRITEDDGLFSNTINSLFLSKNNSLYIGTTHGLNILQNGRILRELFFNNIEINEIIEDDHGSIWVATEMGLGRINSLYKVKELFTTNEGLPTRQVSGLTFDNEGNLWLTTKKGGLIRLKHGNFVNYTRNDGLALDQINIIVEKRPGLYYVGSDDGAINIISNKIVGKYNIGIDLRKNGIRDICFVNSNETWIASYRGILIKRGSEEILLNKNNGLPTDDVRRIYKDRNGIIWAGTRSGGLLKFKDDELIEVYNRNNGLHSNYILSVEEDTNGLMWIGTNGGGLYSIDTVGNIKNFNPFSDASGILIFNIHIDENNIKWLATNVGIFRFKDGEFKMLEIQSNSQNDTFFDIVFDDLDGIWITSNIGVYKILTKDIIRWDNGELDRLPSILFDHNDGLNNKECTGATRTLKTANGNLMIPTLGGVAILNPKTIIVNKVAPPVIISDFLTDRSGEFKSEDLKSGKLILEPGNFRYRIKFTALSYQAPEKVKFRYRLENIDEEWIETINIREVQYTNLPPGNYKFQVLACNNDNIWNEYGASFSFRIKPFIYQQTELYFVVFLLIAIVAYFSYKRRVTTIEKRNIELNRINQELDKFVYSASHDLKAPLNSVLGLINIAKKDGASGNMPLYLQMIEQSINKLEHFITEIIDYSRNSSVAVKSSFINFDNLVEDALSDLKYLEEELDIEKVVNIKGKGEFKSDTRRLTVIFNNLISNSIKYHDRRKEDRFVKITISYDSSKAKIIFEDNGTGIGKEHLDKVFNMFYRASDNSKGSGLGLYIVKETLEKIKGRIKVQSELGKGSTFSIELPSI